VDDKFGSNITPNEIFGSNIFHQSMKEKQAPSLYPKKSHY
jgi:hypothetical protein